MSSLSKLKDEARRHEQREEWEKAIHLYLRVLTAAKEGDAELELPLYNRVGDLYVRLGRAADAVGYYEEAADRYAEAGLYNNAIALCNKALRYAPNRLDIFRKLGRYCALQGFLTDARHWFLQYAERRFSQGEIDEAFDALDDFASIVDDADTRELLGRQLSVHGRSDDALREFRRAYGLRVRAGDEAGAAELREEVLRLYPDLEELTAEPIGPEDAEREAARDTDALPSIEADREPTEPLEGLQSTQGSGAASGAPGALAGFEPTSLTSDETPGPAPPRPDDLIGRDEDVRATAEPLPGLESHTAAEEDSTAPLPLLDESGEPEALGVGRLDLRREARTDAADSEFIDLFELIRPEERPTDTRFRIEERAPTGDEDRDFAELLAQFKAKLAEAVPEDDAASHYDLGLAFREMGLVDEAIGEFQRALRAGDARLKILEELGQCFIEKGQYNVAVKVLARALQLQHEDDLELIGVYYHLGRAYEALGQGHEARDAYERVIGLDMTFRDVAERIGEL